MHCPKCAIDLNDDVPKCPSCGFCIDDLNADLGTPKEKTGLIMDWAGVISDDAKQKLNGRLQHFATRTGSEFLIATIQTTTPRLPSEYVFWLLNRWQVGGPTHSGLLLLLALQERRIEVEVGYSLERFVTDDAATLILQHHAVPFLKAGDVDGGLFYVSDVLARIVEEGLDEERKS